MKKYTVEIDEHGNKIWFNEKGQRHREDGPACEFVVGSKFWYKHGKLHREDGPAMELANGAKEWWLNDQHYTEKEFNAKMNLPTIYENGNKCWYNKNGKFHREDGPAIEYANGSKKWYKNGHLHREDGPAIEDFNGHKEWFKNGERHREDGPASEHPDGYKYWYLNGIPYTEQEFHGKMNIPLIDDVGNKHWYNENGRLHREDGPALEWSSGDKEWALDGKEYCKYQFDLIINQHKPRIMVDGSKHWFNEKGLRHRLDGPAIEYKNGFKMWYKNGYLHREDGPACEWPDGKRSEWWIDGNSYTEKQFHAKMNKPVIDEYGIKHWYNEKGEHHRDDGPAEEWKNGFKTWCKNGKIHRDDGPAVEDVRFGRKEWWLNGKIHREDGPAIEMANGNKYWYLNGIEYTQKEFNDKMNPSKVVEMTMAEINKMAGCKVKIIESH